MTEAYIVDAIRTPTGKKRGALAEMHGADLGATVIGALVERNLVPAEDYDDVIFGCVDTIGPLSGDIARTCWLVAGLPDTVPGVTVDRQCGSSQQAIHFAAQAVMSGTQDVILVGGVQTMSSVPISSAMLAGKEYGFSDPFSSSDGWTRRYGKAELSQFNSAEMIAKKWGLSRSAMERYAQESHDRAIRAMDQGYFDSQLLPVNGLAQDETPRRESSLEKMAELETLAKGGRITAATSSQTCDGAAAVLVVSEGALTRYGLKPRARIRHMSVYGADPVWMLTAPIATTERAMKRSGMRLDDIDLVEINEAFASVPMAWLKELGYPHEQTNVNGGAIALGHPLGATGARLLTILLYELERRELRYGMQTMCEGGGQANLTVIERL